MAFLEQPDSLYNKTIIANIVYLITRDPFRKKILKFLNAVILRQDDDDFSEFEDRITWRDNFFDFRGENIESRVYWNNEIKKIIKDVENLNLPLNVKQDIKNRFFPICFEIKAWIEHYRTLSQCYESSKILDSLCWTCTGVINADKTWQKFVINGFIGDDIFSKYRYACLNCWEENISTLWRLQKINECNLRYIELNGSSYNLVTFWNFYMSNKLNELIDDERSENVSGLHIALQQGNASVIKYFWNKLTPEEKENHLIMCLKRTIPSTYFSLFTHDVAIDNINLYKFTPISCNNSNLYFFLRQLSNEQARIIFSNNNTDVYSILNCFTDFSFRNLFLPIMEYILRFTEISQDDYILLLKNIAIKLIGDPKTYSQLLEYIWRNKIHDKNKAVLNPNWGTIVTALLEAESYESVQLIFDNISVENKELFFKDHGSNISCRLIHQNKFNIFEWFLRICLTNHDAALRFKNYETVRKKLRTNARIQFINIVDRLIISLIINN